MRERSGEQGYFEVRIVRNARDAYMYIGLTTGHLYLVRRDLAPRHWLDTQEVGYGWRQDGVIYIYPTGFEDSQGFEDDNDNADDRRFKEGDVVGMMVDCTQGSTLRYFVNGVQVRRVMLAQERWGCVVFPAFTLCKAQIQIASNPDLPL